MAILRERIPLPGKLGKIFDIRLGLPRDRGFDPNKEAKRYEATRPNERTRVNVFRSMVSQGEGLARPNKFIAVVNLPQALKTSSSFNASKEFAEYSTQQVHTTTLHNLIRDRLLFFCDSAQLPARNITDETKDMLYGPERKIARGFSFADVTLTFYMDQHMAEKMLFESWQNLGVNPFTHNANYYNEYVGSIELYPLVNIVNKGFDPWAKAKDRRGIVKRTIDEVIGKKAPVQVQKRTGEDSRAHATATIGAYYNHLLEVFPTNIQMQQLDYSTNNQLLKLSVDFSYRQAVGPADIGYEDYQTVAGRLRPGSVSLENFKKRGKFSGIIDIAKGVGKDVLNQVKTRFPWGKIFGGKVIPPFF